MTDNEIACYRALGPKPWECQDALFVDIGIMLSTWRETSLSYGWTIAQYCRGPDCMFDHLDLIPNG